jgi:hypothetical protein
MAIWQIYSSLAYGFEVKAPVGQYQRPARFNVSVTMNRMSKAGAPGSRAESRFFAPGTVERTGLRAVWLLNWLNWELKRAQQKRQAAG